jgi:hypothetical protein
MHPVAPLGVVEDGNQRDVHGNRAFSVMAAPSG